MVCFTNRFLKAWTTLSPLAAPDEFPCLRELGTVRIGRFPDVQEFLVPLRGGLAITHGLRGARQSEDGLGAVRRPPQGLLKVRHSFAWAIEVEQDISTEFIRRDDGIWRLRQIVDRIFNRGRLLQRGRGAIRVAGGFCGKRLSFLRLKGDDLSGKGMLTRFSRQRV